MSAQAGVFYLDRRPIPLEVVERMDVALADFGPDGSASRLEPGLLMLSRALHITPEDEREEQPLVSPAGRALTWDGRLDNRDDLLLQFHRDVGMDATDGALALAAFERWGVDGFGRLVGDWSLALWDAPERRLVLASDYMGVRPLYYRRTEDHVAWSSSLGELVLREGVKDDLDDVFVVGFLVGFVPADRTPYLPIRSVTPAHALSFSAAGTTCHRFYAYPANTIRYRHTWEYEEHLRDVFARAVSARLRSTRPVWAELSGGLDSSSIVCMADWLLQRGKAVAPSVETISAVSETSRESDERRFIVEVEKQRQRPGHHLLVEECLGHTDPSRAWIAPHHPADFRLRSIQFVSEHGSRLLLTGNVGDTVMGNSMNGTGHVIEAWRHVGPWAALRESHEWSLATKRTMLSTIGKALPALLPLKWRLRSALHQCLRDRLEGPLVCEIASMLAVDVRRSAYAEFARTFKSTIKDGVCDITPEKDGLRREAHDYAVYGVLKEPSDVPRIAFSHPHGDRRLIELVLAIPCSALMRPGQPRWLMRHALGPLLPERVRKRFSKGYAAPFLTRAVRQTVLDLRAQRQELQLVQRGYLQRDALEIRLDAVQHSPRVSDEGLFRLILLERWLHTLACTSNREDLYVPAGANAGLPHERR